MSSNKSRKYTDQEFLDAIKNNISVAATLRQLNIPEYCSAYKVFYKLAKSLDADLSHFAGQSHSKGKSNINAQKPISEILVTNSNFESHRLRIRLIKEGIFKARCDSCKNTEWMGKPISLELDHIDGDNTNNLISNLRILCPNCHAQTPTYRGKNRKSGLAKLAGIQVEEPKPKFKNCKCGAIINYASSTCGSCSPRKTKIDWPCADELIELVNASNLVQAGKQLGVSDNAIKKRLIGLNLYHLIKDERKNI